MNPRRLSSLVALIGLALAGCSAQYDQRPFIDHLRFGGRLSVDCQNPLPGPTITIVSVTPSTPPGTASVSIKPKAAYWTQGGCVAINWVVTAPGYEFAPDNGGLIFPNTGVDLPGPVRPVRPDYTQGPGTTFQWLFDASLTGTWKYTFSIRSITPSNSTRVYWQCDPTIVVGSNFAAAADAPPVESILSCAQLNLP